MKKQKDKEVNCIYLKDLLNRGIHFDEASQFKTSFFSNVYANATDAVEEIVKDNRKKEKVVGERRKDQRIISVANVISFIGRRGTGKSSVMMSFQDALRRYTNESYQCEKYNNLEFGEEAEMENVRFFSLDYIDASALEESEDVFILVLANMLNYLYSLKSFNDEYNDNSKRELISSFERVYEEFLMLKNAKQDRDGVYSSFETLVTVASSQRIRDRFYNLVQQFISCIRTSMEERTKECYMVISIDDLDMAHYNTQNSNKSKTKINNKSYEIVNSIHKYFSIPGVIVLTAYNYENLMLQSEKFFIESDKTANDKWHEKVSQQMTSSRLASQFVDKVFPPAYRVYLPSWKKNDFGSSSVKVDVTTGVSDNNVLMKYIENADATLSIKKFVLALYAEKTGTFYDPLGKKIHFLEPDSLRKIVDIVAILEGTESNCSKENNLNYTEKYSLLQKIKADVYFRYVQEKLFLSEERVYFTELQELRIDRRTQKLVRDFCGKIPCLGKVVRKDIEAYKANLQKASPGYAFMDYSKLDSYISKKEDNSNVEYSLAEFVHCIYHMTRNTEKYSKEMVSCILNSYTVYLSELFSVYQHEKKKMDFNKYAVYMTAEEIKGEIYNRKLEEIHEIFEALIGDTICGKWTEYYFPETYTVIPGSAMSEDITENIILGCANTTRAANKLTFFGHHEDGLYRAIRACVMFCMFYADVLDWDDDNIKLSFSEGKEEHSNLNPFVTLEILGDKQRIEMTGFLKYSFNYSKYLNKIKELFNHALEKQIESERTKEVLKIIDQAIERIRLEYIKWDYEYGNMALPVYEFDLFYNLIKRLYQKAAKKNRSVRIDTGLDFMQEVENMNLLFIDYLDQIDAYYKREDANGFSEVFRQCPFVQWIRTEKDEKVLSSIGYIIKNMIIDISFGRKKEQSGDEHLETDIK